MAVAMPGGISLVTGGGGFIGGHLGRRAAAARTSGPRGRRQAARGVVTGHSTSVDNRVLDPPARRTPARPSTSVADVYNLAADMGGIGFIEGNKARCMLSVLINTHMLDGRPRRGRRALLLLLLGLRLRGREADQRGRHPLREEDAYPAMPEDGYGWEKLFSERMCRHFTRGLRPRRRGSPATTTSTARTAPGRGAGRRRRRRSAARWPRRQRPASTRSRSGATASQTRSFMYVDDCVEGTLRHRRRASRPSRSTSARGDGHHQPARRHRRGDRRGASSSAPTTSTRRRASAAATPTTP